MPVDAVHGALHAVIECHTVLVAGVEVVERDRLPLRSTVGDRLAGR